jgi:hypothetical protein
LTAAGWAAVARAVAEIAGQTEAAGAAPVESVLDTPVARRLPVEEIATRPAGELRDLARLILLCARPALSRSEPAIADTVARLTRSSGPVVPFRSQPPSSSEALPLSSPGPQPSPADAPTPGLIAEAGPRPFDVTAARPQAAARPSEPAVDDLSPVPGSSRSVHREAELASVSPAGGVFFLIPATSVLDPLPDALADQPLSTVVGWLASRFGEVGTDDPAVHLLAGRPPEPLRPPGPDGEPAIADLADRVTAWLRPLLRAEPGDDLRWLWRRTARIAAEPGWAEITYALQDVDTRIRAAGLDLDPGFVWWLGTVVRYRYA